MKNVYTPLAKIVFLPLRLTGRASATDDAIQKKIYGTCMTTVIISKEEMDDIIQIVSYLEESNLLIRGFSKTTENEAKEQ